MKNTFQLRYISLFLALLMCVGGLLSCQGKKVNPPDPSHTTAELTDAETFPSVDATSPAVSDEDLTFLPLENGTYGVRASERFNEKSVVIPATHDGKPVTYLLDNAFSNCITLQSITLPKSIKYIGNYAFSGCTSLTLMVIPDSVSQIGGAILQGCTALEALTIPFFGIHRDGNYSYLAYAFTMPVEFSLETENVVPASLKSVILTDAFQGYGFEGCTYLEFIKLPSDARIISSGAFEGCTALQTVIFPEQLQTVGRDAFSLDAPVVTKTDGVYYVNDWVIFADGNIQTASLAENTVGIAESAFSNCAKLTEIGLPDSVRTIGYYAFSNCKLLRTITLPDSLTVIEEGAFKGCSELASITIPEQITVIEPNAFRDCTKLREVSLHNGITSLGHYAFKNCSALVSIELPQALTEINNGVFMGCAALETVGSLPEQLASIQYFAFEGCEKLNLETVDGISYLGHWAIKCDPQLTEASLREGTVGIAGMAFGNNKALQSVSLPNGLTYINAFAFDGCASLREITIPNRVTHIGYNAFFQTKITELILPDSVTHFEGGNFSGFERITAPDSLEYCGSINGYSNFEDVENGIAYFGKWCVAINVETDLLVFREDTLGITHEAILYAPKKEYLILPKSLIGIEPATFDMCGFKAVFYEGSRAEWEAVEGSAPVSVLVHNLTGVLYYYSETEPQTGGLYWHYVNEIPTVW